jgi:membrane protein
VAGILPGGAVDIIREQVTRLVAKADAKLGIGFIVGLGIALWSANAGMKAIMDALNVVYEEKEKRGFVKLNLVSLGFTIAAIASMLLALGAVVALPLALGHLGLAGITEILVQVLRWPALLVLVILGLAVIYRFGPSRREPRWQWISIGSVVAAIAWLASSALLSWYLSSFANYDATYGSLGAAIGMMMWMWISSIAILFGAQLNSEIKHQTAHDSTVEHDKPLGARRHHGVHCPTFRSQSGPPQNRPDGHLCSNRWDDLARGWEARISSAQIRLRGGKLGQSPPAD